MEVLEPEDGNKTNPAEPQKPPKLSSLCYSRRIFSDYNISVWPEKVAKMGEAKMKSAVEGQKRPWKGIKMREKRFAGMESERWCRGESFGVNLKKNQADEDEMRKMERSESETASEQMAGECEKSEKMGREHLDGEKNGDGPIW